MKSPFAYLAIVLLWAVLYLPVLGDREIRGEEWRRTLPARTMMNTGEWILTYSGGVPYLHKPPLINWVNAASFTLTGVQNEWTARLPSALLMLGAALGIYALSRRVMGGDAAFVGTVFFLASVGCVEKGRLAEIEVYYIALTGLAFTTWLAGFMGRLSRWVSWLAVGCFLGLAFLAKGPMHLLFFYSIVLGACWKTKRWRELVSLPHLAGLALCLAMVLAWAVPFIRTYDRVTEEQPWLAQSTRTIPITNVQVELPKGALAKWRYEITSRVTGEEESSTKDWLVRGPRALVMFLPWILFLPFLWRKGAIDRAFAEDQTNRTFRGICWGIVASFALMVLLPSSSPRYVAPLLAPVALMIGWAIVASRDSAASANRWWQWLAKGLAVLVLLLLVGATAITFAPPNPTLPPPWQLLILLTGVVIGLFGFYAMRKADASRAAIRNCFLSMTTCAIVMTGYGWLGPWEAARREDIRPVGLAIREAMQPKDAPLYIFHLGQQPYAFYLPENSIELYDLQQLPPSGLRWMLTSRKVDEDFRPLFERRYGTATKMGEWTGKWGDPDQDVNRNMVLLRFAGK